MYHCLIFTLNLSKTIDLPMISASETNAQRRLSWQSDTHLAAAICDAYSNNQIRQILPLCQWISASDTNAQRHSLRRHDTHWSVAISDAANSFHSIKSKKVHIGRVEGELDGSNKHRTFTWKPTVHSLRATKSQWSYFNINSMPVCVACYAGDGTLHY